MTLIADVAPEMSSPTTSARDISWHEVDEQFWTASAGGNHVGVIEFAEGRFRVVDAVGSTVGVSHSLGGARDLLAASVDPDFAPRDLSVPTHAHPVSQLTSAHIVALITLTVSTVAAIGLGAGILS